MKHQIKFIQKKEITSNVLISFCSIHTCKIWKRTVFTAAWVQPILLRIRNKGKQHRETTIKKERKKNNDFTKQSMKLAKVTSGSRTNRRIAISWTLNIGHRERALVRSRSLILYLKIRSIMHMYDVFSFIFFFFSPKLCLFNPSLDSRSLPPSDYPF